jgi:hypothetical protein
VTAEEVGRLHDAWLELHDQRLLLTDRQCQEPGLVLRCFNEAVEAGRAYSDAIRQVFAERDAALARVRELEARPTD